MSNNDAIPEGWTTVWDKSSENTMTIDNSPKKLNASTSGNKNNSDIQKYLDSFNKEIAGREVTQETTNGNSEENAYFIDQNSQYYYQVIIEGGQTVLVRKPSEHDEQFMADINDNNMENDTHVEFPNQHNKIREDIPQVVTQSNEEFQTVLIQADSESKNHVPCVVEQIHTNDDTSNIITELSQDDSNPDNPDIINAHDFNDEQNLTQQKKETMESGEKIDKTTSVESELKKSQSVTGAYACQQCDYSHDKRHLLHRHMKTHSYERPHRCEICDCGFKTMTSLRNHLNTHDGIKPYQCSSCPNTFTTSGALRRHVQYRHTLEKRHKCSKCDYASVELCKMKIHMKSHTNEPYQCPHCTFSTQGISKLMGHLRTHSGEKPYECDICFSKFTQSSSLKTHKQTQHSEEKLVFKCDHCPVTCSRKTDLRLHIEKLHTSDKPVKCKHCGDEFLDRYQFKVHYKLHERGKYFKCVLCPYAFRSQGDLETHIMSTHTNEKLFHCEICNQSFRQKQLLCHHNNLYHNPTYMPPTPHEKPHQCNMCQRSFKRKANLLQHIKIHHKESTGNEQNKVIKQRLEHTDSANKDELEKDSSIPTSDTGGVVSVEGEEDQQYIVHEKIQLDGQDHQKDNLSMSTNDLLQQVNQSFSPNHRNLISELDSFYNYTDKCDYDFEDCFDFDY